ncbi:histone H3-like centromeric protein A [Haematobia irritans]|uniref:histone H3-like centromeric protein A n=1 Tax=Haematobia irritans TaxID=7368 RepID=UPI003F502147
MVPKHTRKIAKKSLGEDDNSFAPQRTYRHLAPRNRNTNNNDQPSTSRDARERNELEFTKQVNNRPAAGAGRRKSKTPRQRQLADLREMRKLQNSTALQIPKAAFARVVREITVDLSQDVTCYTLKALEALHEATEMFLTQVFEDAYILSLHRKCVTLTVMDLALIRHLKFNI